MEFNVDKCKAMHIGRSNPGFAYRMNGVQLKETEEETDVGVKEILETGGTMPQGSKNYADGTVTNRAPLPLQRPPCVRATLQTIHQTAS